jgi:hypothetical protein
MADDEGFFDMGRQFYDAALALSRLCDRHRIMAQFAAGHWDPGRLERRIAAQARVTQ